MIIGVLALQGAFIEHINILKSLNIDCFEVRNKNDLNKKMDGIILPGGESTVISKLLRELDMFYLLKDKIENGLPVFGTCAGMILLAKEVSNDSNVHLGTLNIKVKRNAYGRQTGSFYTINRFADFDDIDMVFIRAPYIEEVGEGVEILSIVDSKIVAARYKNQLVTSFHPELTKNTRVHEYFINMIK